MVTSNPYQQYKQTKVQTAGQGKLILMVYEEILKNIRCARIALRENNISRSNESLIKAQDLVNELIVSLNFDTGEIAKNLYKLYEFSNYRLIQANIKKSPDTLDAVYKIIDDLRTAWVEIINKEGPGTR